MKKILLIVHELTYSGAPRSTLNLAKILRKLNMDVIIWSLQDGEFKHEILQEKFIVKIADFWKKREEFAYELKKFDLVIANTLFCTEIAYWCQEYIKTILYIREAKNIQELLKIHRIDESKLSKIKYILCTSEYAYEYVKQYHPEDGIYILHNYVEDKKYRLRLHKFRSNIFCLTAGTLEYRKGYDVVVKAIENLNEGEKRRIKFFVMGRVVDWSYDYAKKIIDNANTIYLGEITDEKKKYHLFNKMDYIIVPSRDESCSLVALEGAMLGKALIVSENVGAKYMVSASNGYVYGTEKSDELGLIFKEILKDNKLKINSKIKGSNSRRKYKKMASEKKYKKQLLSILKEVFTI